MNDPIERGYYRVHNLVSRVTLLQSDDTQPYQTHQVEGYPGEIRNGIQRMHSHGFSSMPLPGAKGLVVYAGGRRGVGGGTLVGIEDGRYRLTGLNPGEAQLYAVDGADAKGNGGTAWAAFQALLGRVAKMLGRTVLIGDTNTNTITLGGSGTVTINLTGQVVNITGHAGDVVIGTISLVHHVHADAQGGLVGPPQ